METFNPFHRDFDNQLFELFITFITERYIFQNWPEKVTMEPFPKLDFNKWSLDVDN